jgi:hypothetical protein
LSLASLTDLLSEAEDAVSDAGFESIDVRHPARSMSDARRALGDS